MKKLLLLSFIALGFTSAKAQQTFWEEKTTGFSTASTTVSHISYVDGNTVWTSAADGSGGGLTFRNWGRSLDGGNTWSNGIINLGASSADLGIGSIQGISATTAYVAAFPNSATVQGGIFKTTDSGATWVKQTSAAFNTGIDSFANFVYFWDANTGVCQGDPAGGYFEIYTTTNGGTNWTRVPSGNIPARLEGEYGYVHNYDVVGNTIWFGTNKGRIYKSLDQGLNWSVAQSPIADFGSAAISGNYSFRNQDEGLLISSNWEQFRTLDGGVTWTAEFPDGIRNFNVDYVPGVDNFVVTTGEDNLDVIRGSSYSTDGGLTWIDINLVDTDPVDGGGALAFYDATHGLASGFTASSAAGGIWKWIADANNLSTSNVKGTKVAGVSPNPTTGILNVDGKNITNVTVFDVLGKQVLNTNYSALSNVTLNLSALNSGIYMVKVANNAGNTSTIKVVKQ
jgi:photosystem II stability/assembly factor-like uncharacterized protein